MLPVAQPTDETPRIFTFSADALFPFDKGDLADIKPEGRRALANMAAELRKHIDQVRSVHVVG